MKDEKHHPSKSNLFIEDNYVDRVKRIALMMDIRNVFLSHSQIQHALEVVRQQNPSSSASMSLERAKKIVEATVHPDTGQIVSLPLRLSTIVPVNVSLDALMISASSTGNPLLIVAAQTLNQVYNALHYHANANQTNPQDPATRAAAFSLATLSSTLVALLINRIAPIDHHHPSPQRQHSRYASGVFTRSLLLRRLAPFFAVACADLLNVGTIRSNEWLEGIYVYDAETSEKIDRPSRRAGAVAVLQCTLSRIAAAMAPLVCPPLLLSYLEARYSSSPAFRRLRIPILLASLALAIQLGVPLTFAMFKQTGELPVSFLEPELASCIKSARVVYNKGI